MKVSADSPQDDGKASGTPRPRENEAKSQRWSRKTRTWALATLLAGVTAFVTAGITGLFSAGLEFVVSIFQSNQPVVVRVEEEKDCPLSYVFPEVDLDKIGFPPSLDRGYEEREKWAKNLGASDGQVTVLRITVSGTSPQAVILEGLDVEVVERISPAGVEVHAGCANEKLPLRRLAVDLDQSPPKVDAVAGYAEDAEGTLVQQAAVDFPFQVNQSDAEVFYVTATTRNCSCKWRAKLRWTHGEDSGNLIIESNGKLFQTVAIGNLPKYSSTFGESPEPDSGGPRRWCTSPHC